MLDIDVKGALDIKKSNLFQCHYLFITVPSLEELKTRLMARGTETEESLAKRLKNADQEIKLAE